jgi:hypothetical protein
VAYSLIPCTISTSENLSYSFDVFSFSLLDWYLLTYSLHRSNENSHVKANIVHTLYRIKAVGCQPLDSLKELLTKEDYRKCANSLHIEKTWYKLTTDVFAAFLFRVTILLNH